MSAAFLRALLASLCASVLLAACGGGGGGGASGTQSVASPARVINSVPVTVDNGPAAGNGSLNIPYVSVTICRPGTSICQTIDHVMVDTASFGLRLMAPLNATLGLPVLKTNLGREVGECGQFASGVTWGGIQQADVKLGGEVAAAQSIQVIGAAPGTIATPPAECTDIGTNIDTVAKLGANGILGIGMLRHDCGSACANSAIAATYYYCSSAGCSAAPMPLASQVGNPVAAFSHDNNGVILALPTVASAGSASLSGTLVFGIGTQANNSLGNETRFAADASANFVTVYNGARMTGSFIDSGSNGLIFNDTGIARCTRNTDFYCPATELLLNATNESYDAATTGGVTFRIDNIDNLAGYVTAASVGAPHGNLNLNGGNAFDWGLPFFFGRRVFVGFEGTPEGRYWAY